MPQLQGFYAGGEIVKLFAQGIDGESAERIKSLYGSAALESIFSNAALTSACFCLFENDLNVSLTASKLYMHRNTLIYSINKIKRLSGLNLCRFSDAVTFILLYALSGREIVGAGGDAE